MSQRVFSFFRGSNDANTAAAATVNTNRNVFDSINEGLDLSNFIVSIAVIKG